MLTGQIARAVASTVRLQELAEADNLRCDFPARWTILAFKEPRVSNNHEHARYRDENVKRGAA